MLNLMSIRLNSLSNKELRLTFLVGVVQSFFQVAVLFMYPLLGIRIYNRLIDFCYFSKGIADQ